MKNSKRYIILGGLVALLVLTGYINYRINQTSDTTTGAQTAQQTDGSVTTGTQAGEEFFVTFRTDRDNTREKEITYLDELIADKTTDKDTLKEAQQQKLKLTVAMETEMVIEGLIKAKGFSDAVVTINNDSVNVVVDSAQLTSAQVAQILDIVKRESGESAENIKVIPQG